MRASRIGSLVACASLLIACATGGDAIDDGQPGLLGGGGAADAAGADDGGNARGSGSSSGSSSGGGGGGDDASSAVDSGPGDDASAPIDSGFGDAGGGGSSSGGGADGGTVSTFCGSNPAYYIEALSAYTGGSPKLCAKNADCGAGDCCFQAVKQLPVNVCIMQ